MDRYRDMEIKRNDKGVRYFQTPKYPEVPIKESDIYIMSTYGDKLDILAQEYYEDSTLWWVIAISNNIRKDSINIKPGTQIRIPKDISSILSDFESLNK